jgi:hypothetical protein
MIARCLLAAVLALPIAGQGLFEGFTAERLMREDIKSKKRELLEAAMHFPNDKEARTFWTIYRDYESEVATLNDRAFNVLDRYSRGYTKLTPAESAQIAIEGLQLERARVEIREKYFGRMMKAVSPTIASRFVQLESLFHSLLSVQIAMNVALPE